MARSSAWPLRRRRFRSSPQPTSPPSNPHSWSAAATPIGGSSSGAPSSFSRASRLFPSCGAFAASRAIGCCSLAAHLLTTLGFVVMLSRPDPLRDTLLLVRYSQGVVVALGRLSRGFAVARCAPSPFLQLSYVSLAGAVLLSFALIVFGSGPGRAAPRSTSGPCSRSRRFGCSSSLFLAGISRAALGVDAAASGNGMCAAAACLRG